MKARPVLGLTMGDPAGIGPEICLRALSEPALLQLCIPVLFGDASVLQRVKDLSPKAKQNSRTRGKQGMNYRIAGLAEFEGMEAITESLVVDCAALGRVPVKPGKISANCGHAAYVYIQRAIAAAMTGKIAGVVTAPIHKEALRLAGVAHPGHTEIFTALTGAPRSCMMLYSTKLTVSMVTTHIGYGEVTDSLSVRRVHDVMELTAEAMRRLLRREPRLAICGLNPHAGEHGLFGQGEEERLLKPALIQARQDGMVIAGPLPPDAAFTLDQRKKFDAIITLYHDQGHIPFKMLAFDTGVNITLGLPIIRTSVDHGTAFDIAWEGKADPTSLFSAIRVATGLARNDSALHDAPTSKMPDLSRDAQCASRSGESLRRSRPKIGKPK